MIYGLSYIRAGGLTKKFYSNFSMKHIQSMDINLVAYGLQNYFLGRVNLLTIFLVHLPSYGLFFLYY